MRSQSLQQQTAFTITSKGNTLKSKQKKKTSTTGFSNVHHLWDCKWNERTTLSHFEDPLQHEYFIVQWKWTDCRISNEMYIEQYTNWVQGIDFT